MKNFILFFSIISFLGSCQNKESNKSITMNKTRLIDGITLNNSLFDEGEITLKTCKYKNHYIENIDINNLLDKKYCDEFVKYLNKIEKEDDEFKSSLISQLLIIRIYQLKDERAFKALLNLSKNETVSYNGIELYDLILARIFIENPQFFIEQCFKNNDADFLKYVTDILNQYLLDNNFFELNMGYVKSKGGELLLNPEMENKFGNNFNEKMKKLPKIQVIFSPSLYTDWKNKTIFFTDISSVFGKELTDKLSVGASVYYKLYVLSELNKYIIKRNETADFSDNKYSPIDNDEMIAFLNRENIQNIYTINDPDGYTNLRKEKNSSSEVLQKIKSGEHIEVLDNIGDWWQVKTKEGKTGYVHKSRVKSVNSNSHSTSFLLYDRPDFSSFSKEVVAKNDIEIVHQNLGWNFVKINDMTGYLPTEEKKEELQKEEKRKFSFLAEEEDMKPEKKKGFWDNLFG